MGATLSVWNGQYKMIPIYLSVEIQNSNYKIQNTKWYQSISLWQNKIQNDTIIIIFGIFEISISPFIWKEFWFTIPEGNFWTVSMMIDMKGGRTDSWVWFQILFMDGDMVGGGQILETGRYQVRSGSQLTPFQFWPHSFNWQFLFKVFTKILFLSSPSWRGQGREDGRAMLSGSQMVSSMISGNSHGLSSYLSDDIEFLPIVGSANSHSQFIFKQCSCIALGCFSLVFFIFCPPIKNCASAMSCYSFHLWHEAINDG